MIPAVWAALLLAPAAETSALDVARFGARPGAPAALNTRAIQAALDEAGKAGGGTVAVTGPGIYDLAAQGDNPYQAWHRYCLELRYDHLTLLIGPGVTLRLAGGEQTGATSPVDLVVWQARKDLRIGGGGTVSGNTAGQRGWTGGYAQVTKGSLLAGYGNGLVPNERITIENLTLADHFSNAIYLGGHPDHRDLTVKILGVHARDTGEGPLVMNADDVTMRDVTYENRTVKNHPGDGLELWNVADFVIANATVRGTLGGSAIDLHGARRGTVDGFVISGVHDGIEISENMSLHTYSERVEVRNGTITLASAGTGVITKGVRVRDVVLKAVKVKGPSLSGTIGYTISASNATRQPGDDWRQEGPVTLDHCEAHGVDIGLLIKTVANLSVLGGDYSDNRATPHSDGILWMGHGNARSTVDTRALVMQDVKAMRNRRFGLHFDTESVQGREPTGHVANCVLRGNGVEGYHVTREPGQDFLRGELYIDASCFMASLEYAPRPAPPPGTGAAKKAPPRTEPRPPAKTSPRPSSPQSPRPSPRSSPRPSPQSSPQP